MNTPQNTEMIKIQKMKEENMDHLKTIKNKIANSMNMKQFLTQYAYPLKKYKMNKNMDHLKTTCKKEEEKKTWIM